MWAEICYHVLRRSDIIDSFVEGSYVVHQSNYRPGQAVRVSGG